MNTKLSQLQQKRKEELWSLQELTNQSTAWTDGFLEACEMLEVDPIEDVTMSNDAPSEENLKLFPWQVVSITWLIRMEQSKND